MSSSDPRISQLVSSTLCQKVSGDISDKRLYYGYGSNMWLYQMANRCPTSSFVGIARLPGYRWIINDRGYANIVLTSKSASSGPGEKSEEDEVWGMVYTLKGKDEKRLDRNEGVPYCYVKDDTIEVALWKSDKDKNGGFIDIKEPSKDVKVLVYIDRDRVEPDNPKKEYIYRMNMAIADAVAYGIPQDYVDKVMRPFIPKDEAKDQEITAVGQALEFKDED
ncbi:hypothetical protein M501DRAFT_982369 [Patellaria atrata CBS 101060]|uniref:gamma-glutamylcyclotransferase n=1 Tax=Patellaria atrata CBS 101060 TaxID=1346257 RepID=A0A9P4S561_9PEZI|nr:hypothetical protein M501DRAFT_982369 [Patellaria atrata CBS 101060]